MNEKTLAIEVAELRRQVEELAKIVNNHVLTKLKSHELKLTAMLAITALNLALSGVVIALVALTLG